MSNDQVERQELNEILRMFRALRVSRSALLRARWGTSRELLTPSQIAVLMLLIEHQEGLRIGQLASQEHEDAGNITRAVVKLEGDGYVKRLVTEADRRGVVVVATARGKALGKKLIEQRDQFLQDTFSKFSTEHRRQLLAFLEAINSALEDAVSPRVKRVRNVNGKPQTRRPLRV